MASSIPEYSPFVVSAVLENGTHESARVKTIIIEKIVATRFFIASSDYM
jgi:hypothetical protein